MSGTQPVTGSDGSHPPVPVKLSEPERQRVQQADAKLQDYMKQKHSKVSTSIAVGELRIIRKSASHLVFDLLVNCRMCLISLSRHPPQLHREKGIYDALPAFGLAHPAHQPRASLLLCHL